MKFPFQSISAITEDTAPGFYRIDNDAYHAGLGISSTRLKKALVSYKYYTAPMPSSAAMMFGRAFHAALLEPHEYEKIPVITGGNRTRAYTDAVAAGKTVMCTDDTEIIPDMVQVIREHPEYAKLGEPDPEIMAISRDPDTGLIIKCKADLFGHAIVDFKSTANDVTISDFGNAVVNFGYHISAAFYQDVIASLTGERLPFILVPVTKSEPFECEFYRMPDDYLDQGRILYKAALRRVKKWQDAANLDAVLAEEKKVKTLPCSPRVIYNTTAILQYLGELQ